MDYLVGKEPEMFWEQVLLYEEAEAELFGFILFWYKNEYPHEDEDMPTILITYEFIGGQLH